MTAPTITGLPPVPSRNAPATFSDRMDAFLAAFPTFRTDANTLAAYLNNLAILADGGTYEAQATVDDATAGKLMLVGAFGLGGASSPTLTTTIDAYDIPQGTYHVNGTTIAGTKPPSTTVADTLTVTHPTSNHTTQYYVNPNDGQSYVRKSNGTASWGAWRRVFDERGSNGNGEYSRLADGTQICWTALTFANLATATAGSQTWTYPATFTSAPDVKTEQRGAALGDVLRSGHVPSSGTSALIYAYHEIGSTSTRTVSVSAIGRWF